MVKELEKVKEELAEVKKESHKRKKMILAQQTILQSGPNSFNKVSVRKCRNDLIVLYMHYKLEC